MRFFIRYLSTFNNIFIDDSSKGVAKITYAKSGQIIDRNNEKVFKFVMEVQNISFVDAVQQFAESAGAPIPIPNKGNLNDPKYQEREALKKANELAANYFQSLFKESEKGLAARDYLKGRHFTGEILDQYKIGWAIPEWRGLTNHCL